MFCLQLGNDNKNNVPIIIFGSTCTIPITEVLYDPKISVNNKKVISAVLSCSIFQIGT